MINIRLMIKIIINLKECYSQWYKYCICDWQSNIKRHLMIQFLSLTTLNAKWSYNDSIHHLDTSFKYIKTATCKFFLIGWSILKKKTIFTPSNSSGLSIGKPQRKYVPNLIFLFLTIALKTIKFKYICFHLQLK